MVLRGCVGVQSLARRVERLSGRSVSVIRALTRDHVIIFSVLSLILLAFPVSGLAHPGDEARALTRGEEASLGDLRRAKENIAPRTTRYETVLHRIGTSTVITLVTAPEWRPLGERVLRVLERTHERYQLLLGEIPGFAVTLRLLDEETFFLSTGAPRWTNALYYRNQIIIPLPEQQYVDFDNISRSVRHEYTHAVIHALSDGKTPGWIDEGLAQLAEGSENPALRPALLDYLRGNQPVPFRLLQGGFTKLSNDKVAAAYAQALIASQVLLDTFGYDRLQQYFRILRSGKSHPEAFEEVFQVREDIFERRFSRTLARWAASWKPLGNVPAVQQVSGDGLSVPAWEENIESPPTRAQPHS